MEPKTVRSQKTYSLPIQIAEWLRKFFEDNKEELAMIGITSETRLLEVLARNGEQFVRELLDDLKAKKKSRLGPQK